MGMGVPPVIIGTGAESVATGTETETETGEEETVTVERETIETVIAEIVEGDVTGATHAIDVVGGIDLDLDQGGEGDSGNAALL
mmetsp:Transcript_22427/g.36048  ORF Transcript_22427/g.36048 Transcript_22427/m.36048 type:complete len:84 (+) Transcript_22427:708-959(+)